MAAAADVYNDADALMQPRRIGPPGTRDTSRLSSLFAVLMERDVGQPGRSHGRCRRLGGIYES